MTPGSFTLFIGCYTARSSAGVRRLEVGPDGGVTERGHAAAVTNASYLAGPSVANVVYAVSETDDGALVALRVGDDGLVEIDRVPTHGDAPCHVSTQAGRVYVANYASGDVAAYELRPDGRFGPLVGRHRNEGYGPHDRQDGPHAHCIVAHGSFVYAVDLGTDRILRYAQDDGELRPVDETAVPPGSGPRHIAFHPTAPTAFVACELSCSLLVLDVDTATGRLTVRSEVPTLPPSATGDSLAAAVVVHPDGRRVFVSNRGDDSIATYAVDPAGSAGPRLLGHVPSGGRTPRDLALDPAGRTLLAANQDSDCVTAFGLDDGGVPRPRGVVAEVSQPVCLVTTGTR